MSRLTNLAVAVFTSSIAVVGLQAAPAHATTPTPAKSGIVGELGFEGGAYPGGFHPTAGTVVIEFYLQPLVIAEPVNATGHFSIPLGPGQYTITGCGPSASTGTASGECSQPRNITLTPGEVDHIRLVWALAP